MRLAMERVLIIWERQNMDRGFKRGRGRWRGGIWSREKWIGEKWKDEKWIEATAEVKGQKMCVGEIKWLRSGN